MEERLGGADHPLPGLGIGVGLVEVKVYKALSVVNIVAQERQALGELMVEDLCLGVQIFEVLRVLLWRGEDRSGLWLLLLFHHRGYIIILAILIGHIFSPVLVIMNLE